MANSEWRMANSENKNLKLFCNNPEIGNFAIPK
jgi:hypothetical protein